MYRKGRSDFIILGARVLAHGLAHANIPVKNLNHKNFAQISCHDYAKYMQSFCPAKIHVLEARLEFYLGSGSPRQIIIFFSLRIQTSVIKYSRSENPLK